MLPCPRPLCVNTARVVSSLLPALCGTALWLRLPLHESTPDGAPGADSTSSCCAWDAFRSALGDNDPGSGCGAGGASASAPSLLGVILDVGPTLPDEAVWRIWLAEPLRALCVCESAFTTNARGFPVLPKAHQALLAAAFAAGVQVVLRPAPPPPPGAPRGLGDDDDGSDASAAATAANGGAPPPPPPHPLSRHWEYVAFLFSRLPPWDARDTAEAGYRDFLQAPLQPLADDLESATYDTFEKDAAKYEAYQDAVASAIRALRPPPPAASSVPKIAPEPLVVFVLGAGRGPLVRAALSAAEQCSTPVRVYVVEKNPNALVHLAAVCAAEGWTQRGVVALCRGDMRSWAPPERAHIAVSELLGSFGDNELSPECLDGCARTLLLPCGICIPQSYTSFLSPVVSSRLHDEVRSRAAAGGGGGGAAASFGSSGVGPAAWETPYVVKLHRVALLSPPQAVFTFTHPPAAAVVGSGGLDGGHSRSAVLLFRRAPSAPPARVHGLAGYFDAVLHGAVTLSTVPGRETPGLFSWFPIFFPLRSPLLVGRGAAVGVSMWRVVGPGRVWYEWCATAPHQGAIHNVGGRSSFVGLG